MKDGVTREQAPLGDRNSLENAAEQSADWQYDPAGNGALPGDRDLLLSILDSINQIIYVSDPVTYDILFINRYGHGLVGRDMSGMKCFQAFQGRDAPCEFCTNAIIMERKGEPYRWEFHNPHLNKDFLITDRIITWSDGRAVRLEITVDITELNQARKALQLAHDELEMKIEERTSELRQVNQRLQQEIEDREQAQEEARSNLERFELALQGANLGAWDYYPETGNAVFTERWAEMLGYRLDEIEQHVRQWERMVHPDDMPGVQEALQSHMSGEIPYYEAEHRLKCKSGEWKWVLTSGRVVERDSAGTAIRLAGTHLDISERKAAEEAVVAYSKQLEARNSELDQFTYVVSHDLQEPLRKLISFSRLLHEDLGADLPEDAAKDLYFITDAADRMQKLVQDLLALSRIGRTAVKKDSVRCDDCVDAALESLSQKIEETGARIIRDPLPEIVGDKGLLTRLYQNLIENALKFSDTHEPEVRITAQQTDNGRILGVEDNGIGIEAKYADQIFLPFKRLHSRDSFPGTGIGLSICKKITDLMEGRIWVESDGPGTGSRFKFSFDRQAEET